jgi:hypothetical protein
MCKFRVAVVGQFLVFFYQIFLKYREGNHYRESAASALTHVDYEYESPSLTDDKGSGGATYRPAGAMAMQ